MDRDFSLHSGERQVGRCVADIRTDHVARYELAVQVAGRPAENDSNVFLDVFCGNGYGTYMLSEAFPGATVIGIDGSREAIDVANEYYSRENSLFSWKLFPFSIAPRTFDLICCFESLEHVEEDDFMFQAILDGLKPDGLALISVPNQDEHPLEKNPHPFHFRHYPHAELIQKIPSGFSLETWYGQNVYVFTHEKVNTHTLLGDEDMRPREKIPGQISIYIIRREK